MNELELAKQALQEQPLRPEAYSKARAQLRAAMTETTPTPTKTKPRLTLISNNRRTFGLGLGALAAGAAVVFAVTSTSQPDPAPATPQAQAEAPVVVESELITLATQITETGDVAEGDSSLVIRTQKIGDRPASVVWNFLTDSGEFYGGDDAKTLADSIAQGGRDDWAEVDGEIFAKEVEAAKFAVDGDLEEARIKMVDASPNFLGLGEDEAGQQAAWERGLEQSQEAAREKGADIPDRAPTGERREMLAANYLWNNSVDALTFGAGNSEVRAGVLRLISTIDEVDVKKTKTDGKATLTLTAGSALFGGTAAQTLIVDAKTGLPISSSFPAADGTPASKSTFEVSRVSLADAKAGKL